jgi:hypothetical protein
MILFDLKCHKGHVFEAWFRDGATADRQLAGRKVACPSCATSKVEKAPMAPRIGKSEPRSAVSVPGPEGRALAAKAELLRQQLAELRSKVEANCDYVGEGFAEEARKIHYGETDPRGIYGETSDEEAEALQEEGVEFAKIPWLPRSDS